MDEMLRMNPRSASVQILSIRTKEPVEVVGGKSADDLKKRSCRHAPVCSVSTACWIAKAV